MEKRSRKVLVITGAASGLGLAAARFFARDYQVILLDKNVEKLREIKKELGETARILKFDITSSVDHANLRSCLKEHDGFSSLLHFAGISESMGTSEEIYKVNLIGTKILLDNLYPFIDERGVIILVSSITAYSTPIDPSLFPLLIDPLAKNFLPNIMSKTSSPRVAYGWSKRGVMMLAKQEASKWGLKNARIVSISPGAIETPMFEVESAHYEDAINNLIKATPLKRVGETSDVLDVVSFLLSEKSRFVNGTDIVIDGGLTSILERS